MNKPHKHAEVSKAWADGADIEYYSPTRLMWVFTPNPTWSELVNYRVKPKNIVVKRHVSYNVNNGLTKTMAYSECDCNIEYTFDPDGKLLDAKVLK